jgi:hypothetical protein
MSEANAVALVILGVTIIVCLEVAIVGMWRYWKDRKGKP